MIDKKYNNLEHGFWYSEDMHKETTLNKISKIVYLNGKKSEIKFPLSQIKKKVDYFPCGNHQYYCCLLIKKKTG